MSKRSQTDKIKVGAGLAAGLFGTVLLTAGIVGARRLWTRWRNRALSGGHIVILGAGFGGAGAARTLARLLPLPKNGRITLINKNNFLLFTPMLTEAAGGQLDARHIVSPARSLSPRITFAEGRIDEIDLERKQVVYTIGDKERNIPEAQQRVTADHLVIALGSIPNFHGIAGLKEHSLSIKSVADAAALRDRALALLERADAEPDEARRRTLLSFIVGGGGYTGVETMAALNDLLRDSLPMYPHIRAGELRTLIIEPGERLLPELTAKLAAYAQDKLRARGVEVLLKTKITGAGTDYVEIEGGRRIPAQTLVWAGGVTPGPVLQQLSCQHGRHGGIVVDACCAVPDRAGVWAIGDCAEVPRAGGKTYAPTAQNAIRQGALVAHNIVAGLRRESPRPFTYRPLGELALVGKRSGVALIYGLRFSGLPAWVLWRTIYLLKMPGLGQRVRIGMDWLLDLIFGRNTAELTG